MRAVVSRRLRSRRHLLLCTHVTEVIDVNTRNVADEVIDASRSDEVIDASRPDEVIDASRPSLLMR